MASNDNTHDAQFVLETRDLDIYYGSFKAVTGVNMKVERNKITAELEAARTRPLGWDAADGDRGGGNCLSGRAYGHLGYTGTSMWIDPDREMFVILLTNRVHVARARRPAKVISDVRNDLTDAASLAVMDAPDGPMAMPASFRADRMVGWNKVETTRRRGSARSASARSRKAAAARSAKARAAKSRANAARTAKASSSRGKAPALSTRTATVKKAVAKKAPTSKVKKPSAAAKKSSTAVKKPARKPVKKPATSAKKKR